jgi:hypothetical protein
MKAEGEEAFAEKPVGSGAFSVKEWLRGEKDRTGEEPELLAGEETSAWMAWSG